MIRSSHEAKPSAIERTFRAKTAGSGRLMAKAENVMPGGSTRNFGFHRPYPVVFNRGRGCQLWDVDDNRYIDLNNNGLSLIHGHAFPPVVDAVRDAVSRGSAWPGASQEQIDYAAHLCHRIKAFDLVRFTNSGTEAAMLALKMARWITDRPLALKARSAYHGSYDDLEAGLHGRDEIPGRTLLADFGDLESFAEALRRHPGQVAAIVVEPVLVSGPIVPPPSGFLNELQTLAQKAGALFVLDDCLMLRLAPGGSAEKYGLDPDLTFLGKFVGGGLPMGVVGGRRQLMQVLDPRRPDVLHHGGSFNGNLLAVVAGYAALRHFNRTDIDAMDRRLQMLRSRISAKAQALELPFAAASEGSVLGVYFTDQDPAPGNDPTDPACRRIFHLACLNNGVLIGTGGQIAMSTAITDELCDEAATALEAALDDVAAWLSGVADD